MPNMSLYQILQKATSEEDVKDAYIKALGLKEYQKNLVDIQTNVFGADMKVTLINDKPVKIVIDSKNKE